ncbi:hypothetical protein Tco_0169216, partial [Tanacetum coccineum]
MKSSIIQLQQLLYNGKEMRNAETFSGFGLTNGDLVLADEEKAKAIAFDEINKSPEENKRRLTVETLRYLFRPQVAEKQFGHLIFSMAMQAISVFKIGAFVCWDLSVYEGYGVRMHSDNTKVSNGGEVQCFEGLCIVNNNYIWSHRSNNYSESKRNDHLDNNRRQEQRNK